MQENHLQFSRKLRSAEVYNGRISTNKFLTDYTKITAAKKYHIRRPKIDGYQSVREVILYAVLKELEEGNRDSCSRMALWFQQNPHKPFPLQAWTITLDKLTEIVYSLSNFPSLLEWPSPCGAGTQVTMSLSLPGDNSSKTGPNGGAKYSTNEDGKGSPARTNNRSGSEGSQSCWVDTAGSVRSVTNSERSLPFFPLFCGSSGSRNKMKYQWQFTCFIPWKFYTHQLTYLRRRTNAALQNTIAQVRVQRTFTKHMIA